MLNFGNICLGLAALIYLLPWQMLLNQQSRGSHASVGLMLGSIVLVLPMGASLAAALLALSKRGGLDWLTPDRPLQYLGLLGGLLALTLLIGMASAFRFEPATQIPWALRPMVPLAAWIVPPFLIVSIAILLNGPPGHSQLLWARGALLLCTGVAVLVVLGMLVELGQWKIAQGEQRLREVQAFQDQRDARILAEVQQMNPNDHFASLLNFSNIHETAPIRELALQKLAGHPDLTAGVAHELTAGAAYEAIIYLEGNQPPQPELLAEPIRVGIERITAELQRSIQGTHTLHAEQGFSKLQRILEVVRKYERFGVDYRPALRTLRSAFDHGRDGQVELIAAGVLDRWLRKADRVESR